MCRRGRPVVEGGGPACLFGWNLFGSTYSQEHQSSAYPHLCSPSYTHLARGVLDREPGGRQTHSPGRQPWGRHPTLRSPARGGRLSPPSAERICYIEATEVLGSVKLLREGRNYS